MTRSSASAEVAREGVPLTITPPSESYRPEGDRVEVSCSDLVQGSGVHLVEVGDSLWCVGDEGGSFPRVVAGVVALPPDFVLEFAAE